MTRMRFLTLLLIGGEFGLAGSIDLNSVLGPRGVTEAIELTTSKAYAARKHKRRATRRVARRTTRRVIRRHTLAAGCLWRAPYHYCGGVYYQPIVESGATVYIVVYP